MGVWPTFAETVCSVATESKRLAASKPAAALVAGLRLVVVFVVLMSRL